MWNRVESFGGIIELRVVKVVDCRRKLIASDGTDDDVYVPCLAVGKVGGASCFAGRGGPGRS